jgi:hypothetical protein
MSKIPPQNIRTLAVLKGSVIVNGKEDPDKNPYLSPARFPACEPELDIGPLKGLLEWKSTFDSWKTLMISLASLQTVMSLVTLSAFDKIVRYISVDKTTGQLNLPMNALTLSGILIFSGELFVLLIGTRIVERYTKDIFWHRALRHGVLVDFKNAKLGGRKNIGFLLYVTILISAIALLFIGLNMEASHFQSKGSEYWAAVVNTLLGIIPLFTALEKVIKPYTDTELFESTLVPLPKYIEEDYNFSVEYLTKCKIIPEKAAIARLCDLNNYWHISKAELQMTWAQKYNYEIQHRMADFESQLSQDHLEIFREEFEKVKEECKISFNMLHESEREGEDEKGGLIVRNLKCVKVSEKEFQYNLTDCNVRFDHASVINGRYNNIFITKMSEVQWADEKLDSWFRSIGKMSKAERFQIILISIAGAFFISSGLLAMWTVMGNYGVAAAPPPPSPPLPPPAFSF